MTDGPAAPPARALDARLLLGAKPVDAGAVPVVTNLPPFAKAGVDLARIVLWFIAGAAILLLGLIAIEEFGGNAANYDTVGRMLSALAAHSPGLADSAQVENYRKSVDATKSLLDTIAAAQLQTRDFMLKLCQLILVGILLPILTALLGYIFGTQQAGAANRPPDHG